MISLKVSLLCTHKYIYFLYIFYGCSYTEQANIKNLQKKKEMYKYPEHRINKRIREIMVDP